jgi:hypothetical protein
MRITLLSCIVLALTTTNATAPTTYVGPWQPRPTIGIGLGAFGAITNNGSGNLIQSGTLEIPVADKARVRIELGRAAAVVVNSTFQHHYGNRYGNCRISARLRYDSNTTDWLLWRKR